MRSRSAVVQAEIRRRNWRVSILQQRLERSHEEELQTGLRELVAIARDRWLKG